MSVPLERCVIFGPCQNQSQERSQRFAHDVELGPTYICQPQFVPCAPDIYLSGRGELLIICTLQAATLCKYKGKRANVFSGPRKPILCCKACKTKISKRYQQSVQSGPKVIQKMGNGQKHLKYGFGPDQSRTLLDHF